MHTILLQIQSRKIRFVHRIGRPQGDRRRGGRGMDEGVQTKHGGPGQHHSVNVTRPRQTRRALGPIRSMRTTLAT